MLPTHPRPHRLFSNQRRNAVLRPRMAMDLRGMRLDTMGATVKEDKLAIDVYSQAQATGTSSPWAGRAPVDRAARP
jgi:hypothetical protein